jgi:hypothetical protein
MLHAAGLTAFATSRLVLHTCSHYAAYKLMLFCAGIWQLLLIAAVILQVCEISINHLEGGGLMFWTNGRHA